MFAHTLCRLNGQVYCQTTFDPVEGWLVSTRQGFVTEEDSERGAPAALEALALSHVLYLLNDNSQIRGPWFNSLDWLRRAWVPQVHAEAGMSAYLTHQLFEGLFDLQFFASVEEDADWLRGCQQAAAQPSRTGAGSGE